MGTRLLACQYQCQALKGDAVTLQHFRRALAPLDGTEVRTLSRGRPFRIRVVRDGLVFAPLSSGKERTVSWAAVGAVLTRFVSTGSFVPLHYRDKSFHASYILALLKATQGA